MNIFKKTGWARNFEKIQPADSQPEPGWPTNFPHEPEARARKSGWARNFVKIQPADSQPEPGWPAIFANPCSERLEHITLGFISYKKSEVKKIYYKNKSGVWGLSWF